MNEYTKHKNEVIDEIIDFMNDTRTNENINVCMTQDVYPQMRMSDGKTYGKRHMTIEISFDDLLVKADMGGWEKYERDGK